MSFDEASILSEAHKSPLPDQPGESSYFSTPSPTLDPNLFDGEHLKPDVRNKLLSVLFDFMDMELALKSSRNWVYVWLAGSGASYQWASPRGNGDLDVLFGVDYAKFIDANNSYSGLGPQDVADFLDQKLKATLWPETAATKIGTGTYEVTYFIDRVTGTDISTIHPYAAYNIYPRDEWDVTPPKLPEDPTTLYSPQFFKAAQTEDELSNSLIQRYAELREGIEALEPGSAAWVNRARSLSLVVDQATAQFDSIHQWRREAFSPQGHGYGDFANFLWQHGKRSGAVGQLRAIRDVGKRARSSTDTGLYGAPIEGATALLNRAAFGRRS